MTVIINSPLLYFRAVCWPCMTFTNSESNGKVQYNIRTTKNLPFDIPVLMLTPYECVELRY